MANVNKRFAEHSAVEIDLKRMKVSSDETLKANEKAARLLRQYLKEKQMDEDFENFDPVRLDEVLQHFYMDARKENGEYYKVKSLEQFKHSLNRYLRNPPFNKKFNIVKNPEFGDSNSCFEASIAELKRLGKGSVDHHPIINEADRNLLYTSIYFNPDTPEGLFNKVQFDIRLYFCRRAAENMHSMNKSTFAVHLDPVSNLKFVIKTGDELTKNHRQNDTEHISGVMTESADSPFCPVRSFERYLNKLHPENNSLWQRPRDSFTENDEIWYCNQTVGEKTLKSFMRNLSNKCKLSQNYTNHCIRATGITILTQNMFSPSQIMAVTGHKSVQSIAVYQRTSVAEKLQMGKVMGQNITKDTRHPRVLQARENLALPAAKTNKENEIAATTSTTTDFSLLQGVPLSEFDTELEQGHQPQTQYLHSSNLQTMVSRQILPAFHNCSIGTLNLNINFCK